MPTAATLPLSHTDQARIPAEQHAAERGDSREEVHPAIGFDIAPDSLRIKLRHDERCRVFAGLGLEFKIWSGRQVGLRSRR